MNLETALYLCDFLSGAAILCVLVVICGTILMVMSFIGKLSTADERDCDHHLYPLWCSALKKWPLVLVAAILAAAIPSKSTMYLMMGTSYLKESNLPAKVSRALELKLDEYMDELINKKDKK